MEGKSFLIKWVIKKKTSHQHFDVVITFQLISMNNCANDTSKIICRRRSERLKVSYDLFILNPSAANSIQIRLSQTFSSFARPPLLLTGFSLFTADCFVYRYTKAIWL